MVSARSVGARRRSLDLRPRSPGLACRAVWPHRAGTCTRWLLVCRGGQRSVPPGAVDAVCAAIRRGRAARRSAEIVLRARLVVREAAETTRDVSRRSGVLMRLMARRTMLRTVTNPWPKGWVTRRTSAPILVARRPAAVMRGARAVVSLAMLALMRAAAGAAQFPSLIISLVNLAKNGSRRLSCRVPHSAHAMKMAEVRSMAATIGARGNARRRCQTRSVGVGASVAGFGSFSASIYRGVVVAQPWAAVRIVSMISWPPGRCESGASGSERAMTTTRSRSLFASR